MRRVLSCAVLAMASCVTVPLSGRAQSVLVTDAAHVTSCKPLGQVSGSSGTGGILSYVGLKEAKAKALDAAGALAATHIVWLEPTAGGDVQIASGLAYRCE